MVMFGGVDCYKCGLIVPLEDVRARTIEVESGRSGGFMTYRGSIAGYTGFGKTGKASRKSAGMSYNTGRTYYKKVKVYVCNDCLRKEHRQAVLRTEAEAKNRKIIFVAVAVLVGILYFA